MAKNDLPVALQADWCSHNHLLGRCNVGWPTAENTTTIALNQQQVSHASSFKIYTSNTIN